MVDIGNEDILSGNIEWKAGLMGLHLFGTDRAVDNRVCRLFVRCVVLPRRMLVLYALFAKLRSPDVGHHTYWRYC